MNEVRVRARTSEIERLERIKQLQERLQPLGRASGTALRLL